MNLNFYYLNFPFLFFPVRRCVYCILPPKQNPPKTRTRRKTQEIQENVDVLKAVSNINLKAIFELGGGSFLT